MSQRKRGDMSDRITAETIKFMKKGLDETEVVSMLVVLYQVDVVLIFLLNYCELVETYIL